MLHRIILFYFEIRFHKICNWDAIGEPCIVLINSMEMMDRLLFSRRSSHHQWKLLHCFFLILIVLPLLTLFLSYKCNLSTYRLSFSLSKQWAMNKSILRGIVISINVWKHTPVRHCIMYQYPTPIDKFAYNSLYTCSSTTSSL